MVEPRLYERYDRHEVVASFGSEAAARILCDGQWVILPEAVLCFADVGPPPRTPPPAMSHIASGSVFCWVADKPYTLRGDQSFGYVPDEVARGKVGDRRIVLFVRPQAGQNYVYLGTLEPLGLHRRPGNHGEANFRLSPTLPSRVWAGLGGPKTDGLDHSGVDSALARLGGITTPEDRFAVLRQVVEYWHGPLGPGDGIPEEELRDVRIPTSLRRWYRWAGGRQEIMCGEYFLLDPADLEARGDLLAFYAENQWSYEWATATEGDDPAVFGRIAAADYAFEPEHNSVTEHLVLAALFNAIIVHAPYGAEASCLGEDALNEIAKAIPPVALRPWRYGPTQFYAGGGAFMWSSPSVRYDGRRGHRVWIGARTEYPVQFLKRFAGESWDSFTV